jgi:hypothetical protein
MEFHTMLNEDEKNVLATDIANKFCTEELNRIDKTHSTGKVMKYFGPGCNSKDAQEFWDKQPREYWETKIAGTLRREIPDTLRPKLRLSKQKHDEFWVKKVPSVTTLTDQSFLEKDEYKERLR